MQIPSKQSIVMVGNKSLVDDEFNLIQSAIPIFQQIIDQNAHIILAVKVKNDEQEEKVQNQIKQSLPTFKQHHIIFYEQDQSVYSISRQFNPNITFHAEETTLNQLTKFIKSILIQVPLNEFFK